MAQADIAGYLKDWKAQTFNALPNEDLQLWLCDIRYGLKRRRVPRADWVPVAYHFLGPELQGVLGEVQEGIEKLEPGGWNWDRFTSSLVAIHERVKKDAAENNPETIGAAVFRLRRDYPVQTAAAGIGLIALGGVVAGPAIVIGTLKILGFHVTGIAGGTIAAGIKTTMYGSFIAGRTAVAAAGPVRALSAGAMAVGAWAGFEVRDPSGNSNAVAAEPDSPAELRSVQDATTMTDRDDDEGRNNGTVAAEPVPLEDASATTGDGKGLNNSTVAAEPDSPTESSSIQDATTMTDRGNDEGQNDGIVAAEPVPLWDASAATGDDKGLNNSPVAAEPDNPAESISLGVDEHTPSPASVIGNDSGSNNAELISLEDDESAESAATIHAEKGPNIDPVAAGPVPLEDDEHTISAAPMTDDHKSPISLRDVCTE